MSQTEGRHNITRDDVAARAGVSSATVSYVLNDGPRPVAEKTRTKVLRAIEELGYQPNAIARNLRRQRTSTLGLIIPDTLNPYFAEVARGIEAVAFERGYTVVLCHSRYRIENEKKYVDVLRAERAAGIIWIPATEDFQLVAKFVDYGIPFVVLDRATREEGVFSVTADNFRGGFMATEHLISLGHERIGFIRRSRELTHSTDRLLGYKAALEEHGLHFDEDLLASGGYAFEDGRRASRELLESAFPPTAIFSYNDIMAIGALRSAHEMGLNVPKDISIVGFDDIPIAAFTYPPLTTICQPKLEMGQRSAEMLFELIDGKEPTKVSSVIMDIQMKVRESTGPVPK